LAARHAVSVKTIDASLLLASGQQTPGRGQHQGQQIHEMGRYPKVQIEMAEGVRSQK
jgi:hypothetical protein